MNILALPAALACPTPWDDASLPLLTARGLALQRGGRELCCPFELDVRAGQCVAILGRNGAGKTTLLHALAGLHGEGSALALSGEVRFGQRPAAHWPARQAARFRGLLPQRQPLPFAANVLETVLVGRHPHLGRWERESDADTAIAHAALAAVGLAGFDERDLRTLSGGERQRVTLAALLAQTPRLFLLDEPLNHLDLHHRIAVLELLAALAASGRGVAMVLHDLELAARYADTIVLLDGDGGVTVGPTAGVLTPQRLSHAFGHPLRRFEIEGRAVFLPE
ncbi:MAG: ABC transporter ATP-binding protein [Azoarcus sp.]|jgi:iron complex transport system ATP-binding protein|nr:ABC transporter ATP-binding protein [Azoarcus sp.]